MEEYKNREIQHYQRYPLKKLIENVEMVITVQGMQGYINDVVESVRGKCMARIQALADQKSFLENGLNNKELLTLKRVLRSLPDDLKDDLKEQIENLEVDFVACEEDDRNEMLGLLDRANVDEIMRRLNEAARQDRKEINKFVEENILKKMDEAYTSMYDSAKKKDSPEQMLKGLQGVLKYEPLGETHKVDGGGGEGQEDFEHKGITKVAERINKAKATVVESLRECAK